MNQVQQLGELVKNLQATQNEIEKQEARLDDLKQREKRIKMELIPDLFATQGIDEISLAGIGTIRVNPFYAASIPEENRIEAFTWLRDNNHAEIIKTGITLHLTKEQQPLLVKVRASFEKLRVPFVQADTVHGQTLKAFVREQLEGGHKLPPCINVFVGKTTVIGK